MEYGDGSTYEGEFLADWRVGKGKLVDSDGTIY